MWVLRLTSHWTYVNAHSATEAAVPCVAQLAPLVQVVMCVRRQSHVLSRVPPLEWKPLNSTTSPHDQQQYISAVPRFDVLVLSCI